MQGTSSPKALLTLFAVVILVMVVGFAFYSVQSYHTLSLQKETIASQSTELGSQAVELAFQSTKLGDQAVQLARDDSMIENLTSTMTSLQSQAKSLQSEAEADEANITLLISKGTKENVTISSLDSEVTSLNLVVTNLNSKIAVINNKIAGYQSQIASLQVEMSNLYNAILPVDVALAEPCIGQGACAPDYLNYSFSVPQGSMKIFNFTAAGDGGVLLVAVVSSTSNNTLLFTPNESTSMGGLPTNVGSRGFFAVSPEEYDYYSVYIYDQNLQAFSAVVNIWYFS